MKALLILLALCLAAPGQAASLLPEPAGAKSAAEAPAQPSANATAQAAPDADYSCRYYKVKMPPNWKAIVPPEETLGSVNAIFATDTASSVVTIVAGPSGGEDAQTVAEMFASQFKAPKPPTLKNGQYIFQFPIQKSVAQAWVAAYDNVFMMTYIAGNKSQGLGFIRDCVKSDSYPGLLPQ